MKNYFILEPHQKKKNCLGLFWLFLWIIPGSAPTCDLQELFMEREEFSIQFAHISKTEEASWPNGRLVTAGELGSWGDIS